MAETFYATAQEGKNMNDLAEAATGVLNNNDNASNTGNNNAVQHAKP
jgi:hypothetical protein